MSKPIRNVFKTETLTMTECTDGFWLYDKNAGYNIVMRAKTEQSALIEAITFYQKKLSQVEAKYSELSTRVNHFVTQLGFDIED